MRRRRKRRGGGMVVEVVFSDEIREERIYNRVVILVYAHTLRILRCEGNLMGKFKREES